MKPNINVTPLIDVLLVLLIIFMVVAPAKPTKFDAKVPVEPRTADRPEQDPNRWSCSSAATAPCA